jgi:hypothetical protein
MVIVFTAMFGTTDMVRTPKVVDPTVQYVCFSDRAVSVAPYECIVLPPSDRPMLAARRLKILADHPRLAAADVTLWHDASFRLRRNLSWLHRGLRRADLVAMPHARRTRIEDEALIVARYGYVTVPEGQSLIAEYRAAGFDANVLTSTGLLGRRVSPETARFNTIWWNEAQRWNGRDQTSVDYAAWRASIRVAHMPGTARVNRCADWRARPS